MTCELTVWDPPGTFCRHPKRAPQIPTIDRSWDSASLVHTFYRVSLCLYFKPKIVSRGLFKKQSFFTSIQTVIGRIKCEIPSKPDLSSVCFCVSLCKHVNTLGS